MNKLKIMYDVFRTMKEKDVFNGTLKVEGMKDQVKVFGLDNAFERNNLTGQTKAKICIEADQDGKKMKIESSIDSEIPCCHGGHHGFMKHMHARHDMLHNHEEKSGGLKGGLNKITTILGILHSLKVEEQEGKSVILSLELADIPEDLKKLINEKMAKGCEHHGIKAGMHDHHRFMKEFHTMEKTDFKLNVFINGDSEIEKVALEVSGEQKDEKDVQHQMKLTAGLCITGK